MRVLVVESDAWSGESAKRALRAAGHETVTCMEPGGPSLPCRALMVGERCPLDEMRVDCVLDVRGRPWPSLMPRERGAICGIRAGVPLVVAGAAQRNPLHQWTEAIAADDVDVVAECEAAAAHHSLGR